MRRKIIIIHAFIIINLSIISTAKAGGIGEIGDPVILPSTKHKILVLEYDNPETALWGRELSQVIAQEILGSILGVSDVGVINLRQKSEHFDLTSEKVEAIALQQGAHVVIWGEFYQNDKNVYIHSHLRIIKRKDYPESSLGLSLSTKWGVLNANPPTLQINFAPVAVPKQLLRNLHEFYSQTNTIHAEPRNDARKLGNLKTKDTYYIREIVGDWTRIGVSNGLTGWIRHATLGSENELNDIRVVVRFSQGLLQYLAGSFSSAQDTLMNYIIHYGKEQDPMNRALAHILLANSRLRAEGYEHELPPEEEISIEYLKASDLLPNNASPVNYLTIALMLKYGTYSFDVPEMHKLEEELIRVIKLDNNTDSVHNLYILYRIAAEEGFLKNVTMDNVDYESALSEQVRLLEEMFGIKPYGPANIVHANEHSITIMEAPTFGTGPASKGLIRGIVKGLDVNDLDNYRVVIYSRTHRFYVQPFQDAPYTAIHKNGNWVASIHLGREYVALLVKKNGSRWPPWPSVVQDILMDVDGVEIIDIDVAEPGFRSQEPERDRPAPYSPYRD